MPSDPRDYKLDLANRTAGPAAQPGPGGVRPFLSVLFSCCGAYTRVYRNPADDKYRGRCPRCLRAVTFAVGEGGTSARAFVVS